MEKIFIAGVNETKDGSLSVLVKNAMPKTNKLRRLAGEQKATKSGSFWINKGNTREEVLEAYPVGSVLKGAEWGTEVKDSEFGGLFNLVFKEDLEEVEEEEGKEGE